MGGKRKKSAALPCRALWIGNLPADWDFEQIPQLIREVSPDLVIEKCWGNRRRNQTTDLIDKSYAVVIFEDAQAVEICAKELHDRLAFNGISLIARRKIDACPDFRATKTWKSKIDEVADEIVVDRWLPDCEPKRYAVPLLDPKESSREDIAARYDLSLQMPVPEKVTSSVQEQKAEESSDEEFRAWFESWWDEMVKAPVQIESAETQELSSDADNDARSSEFRFPAIGKPDESEALQARMQRIAEAETKSADEILADLYGSDFLSNLRPSKKCGRSC